MVTSSKLHLASFFESRMNSLEEIFSLRKVGAVIFDVDGTLYDHKKIKRKMMVQIAKSLFLVPSTMSEIKVVNSFRKNREKMVAKGIHDIERKQYEIVAKTAKISEARVREIIQKWMYEIPSKHLFQYRYSGIQEFIDLLGKQNILTAVFSDFLTEEKLRALKLAVDVRVCSTDPDVDRFKPDPAGLLAVGEKLGVPVENCVYIGDQEEKDGQCASQAGMRYLQKSTENTSLEKFQFFSFHQLVDCVKTWQ